jgi:hypothetical protein
MDELGAAAGMLLVPSTDPERAEEWIFYIEPRCYIVKNLYSLITTIGPMVRARVLSGHRVKVSFLVCFNADYSPGEPNMKARFVNCIYWSKRFISDGIPMAKESGLSIGLYSAMCIREPLPLWRFYFCPRPTKLNWSPGVYPFPRKGETGVRIARHWNRK